MASPCRRARFVSALMGNLYRLVRGVAAVAGRRNSAARATTPPLRPTASHRVSPGRVAIARRVVAGGPAWPAIAGHAPTANAATRAARAPTTASAARAATADQAAAKGATPEGVMAEGAAPAEDAAAQAAATTIARGARSASSTPSTRWSTAASRMSRKRAPSLGASTGRSSSAPSPTRSRRKPVSQNYVLQREGNDSEFPTLGAARDTVKKKIVHPEKLTLSKAEHVAAKKQ